MSSTQPRLRNSSFLPTTLPTSVCLLQSCPYLCLPLSTCFFCLHVPTCRHVPTLHTSVDLYLVFMYLPTSVCILQSCFYLPMFLPLSACCSHVPTSAYLCRLVFFCHHVPTCRHVPTLHTSVDLYLVFMYLPTSVCMLQSCFYPAYLCRLASGVMYLLRQLDARVATTPVLLCHPGCLQPYSGEPSALHQMVIFFAKLGD